MAPTDGDVIRAPTFARTTVVTGHSPTQSVAEYCLDWWQIHDRCDETSRVAAPCVTTGDWATSTGADRAIVTTRDKRAVGNLFKCVSAIGAEFQYAAVETDSVINIRGFEVEVMPERQLWTAALKEKTIESSRLSLKTSGSSMDAALGAVFAGGIGSPESDVIQSGGGPNTFVASHPCGKAGGVTPSKSSFELVNSAHGGHRPREGRIPATVVVILMAALRTNSRTTK